MTLCTTALHADYKKATIKDTFVGKRCVDSEEEENGIEPKQEDIKKGGKKLYAYARIMVEHDDGEFLQSDGTEFKSTGIIKGVAPTKTYNGYWYMELDAWKKGKSYPNPGGSKKWKGAVDKDYEVKDKWTGEPKHLKPLVNYLWNSTATACINGGERLQYWTDRGMMAPHEDLAYAYADDFSRDEADDWDEPSTPGLYLQADADTIEINGEEMLDTKPGDTVTVNLVMPSDKGYARIHWYLSDNELGAPMTPSGTGIETEVTHTFSMPSDASGVYTFKAYIYPHSSASDQSVYEYTIKIYCS